ncbi:MAG: pantetheine-phosphate adenylyltransferase [Mycoplasmataceae bacterium]|jgi:pantetheine-phosphate adenylyltransferase|nr:pantetheine-phosphate adenylyltransferase [Mycoplasmataceae bacterium]
MKQLRKAVFPGSFNPIHSGHINIIKRAANLFDYLYVVVSKNIDKKYEYKLEQRLINVQKVVDKLKLKNVKVVSNTGLTIDLVKKLHCQYIVRSIRNAKDVGYEVNMAQNNNILSGNVETIFFVADSKLKDVSSTNRKELIRQKQLISKGTKHV